MSATKKKKKKRNKQKQENKKKDKERKNIINTVFTVQSKESTITDCRREKRIPMNINKTQTRKYRKIIKPKRLKGSE